MRKTLEKWQRNGRFGTEQDNGVQTKGVRQMKRQANLVTMAAAVLENVAKAVIVGAVVFAMTTSVARAYTIESLAFQSGIDGYTGTVDTWVGDGSAHGSEPYMLWRLRGGVGHYRPVIRFDDAIETVPADAFVLKAHMTLVRSGGSGPDGENEDGNTIGFIQRVSNTWSDSSTSVSQAGNRRTVVQGHWASGLWPDQEARNIDLTALARGWHAGTFDNHGVVFNDTNNQQTHIALHSSETETVSDRPQLTIEYIAPTSPREQIVVLSAANLTADTWLNSAQSTTNYGDGSVVQIGRNQPGGGGYGIGLLRFDIATALEDTLGDNWNEPTAWEYKAAWMGFHNGSGVTAANFTAYPLSADAAWTEDGATWDTMDGVNPWPAAWTAGGSVPPEANRAAGLEDLVYGNTFNGPTIMGMSMWDVTDTVSNFIYGDWENNGWVFPSWYGLSGGASGFFSSEGTDFALGGPFLVIVMQIPEPTSLALLGLGSLALLKRRRK